MLTHHHMHNTYIGACIWHLYVAKLGIMFNNAQQTLSAKWGPLIRRMKDPVLTLFLIDKITIWHYCGFSLTNHVRIIVIYITDVMLMLSCSFPVAVCNGFKLPARWVIHVNGPTTGDTDAFEKLERCVKNCLVLADTRNLKSLALPSIGSGK